MTQEMIQALEGFQKRFKEIIRTNSDKHDKYIQSVRLSALVTDLEAVFQIPTQGMERIEAFKRAFPDVFNFYKNVKQVGGVA